MLFGYLMSEWKRINIVEYVDKLDIIERLL
jgi:hypothetical protein